MHKTNPPEPAPAPPSAHEAPALSVQQARAAMQAVLRPIAGVESVPLQQALGRVLAAELVSPINVPAHDNAAMDGFAFAGSLLHDGASLSLPVVASVLAGAPLNAPLARGDAVRIMTGAMLPAGADTVAAQEQVCWADGRVHIEAGAVSAGDNRRCRGEDLALGATALPAGRVLTPADLGLAASLGLQRLSVKRRLRVALFSSGNELRAPGQALDAGCIYDSNRSSLHAALQRLGVEVLDLGLVRDEPQALRAALQGAAEHADAVLTSGGVSVGDADHTRAVLAQLGEVDFWKLNMRPGRPFAFGSIRRPQANTEAVWLFALPGNPVAALVSFYVLVRDALLQLAGAAARPLPLLQLPSVHAINKRAGRAEYPRAIVGPAPGGGWQVQLTGPQGAGVLSSLSQANALLVLNEERGAVAAGEMVQVWLLDGLV